MILAVSDVASLADALTKWEYAEYLFATLVTIACLGEFVAEFTNWFTRGVEHRKKRLGKGSTLVLIGALALELICLVKTNRLSSDLIGSLSEQSQAATAALDRIKSPRSLVQLPKLIATLTVFKDTEYTFSAVFADGESLSLLKSIDDVLQRSGWKRVRPPDGFPAINIFGNDPPFAVPVALTDGVRISADSREETAALRSVNVDRLPPPVKASVSLYFALASNMFPPEEHPTPVNLIKGESKVVRISVGKKLQ